MTVCACTPCARCDGARLVCGACGRCARHDRHAEGCPGCKVPAAPTYTVDAGRQILRDGVRVASVYSRVQTGERNGLAPADADDFAHVVARALNLLEGQE